MDVLRKITFASVRLNRKRTTMTVIGVALSCALVVAVAGMVSSAHATILHYYYEYDGDYHALFYAVDVERLPYVDANIRVKNMYPLWDLGYATAQGSINEYKPYYHLTALATETMPHLAFQLTDGRFPENENEALIAGHIRSNGGIHLKVGDTLSLQVGTRVDKEGNRLTQTTPYEPEAGERIADTTAKTYTIVGRIDRPPYAVEPYAAPGYTLITCAPENMAPENAQPTCDVAVRFYAAREAGQDANILYETLYGERGGNWEYNDKVLSYEGGIGDDTLAFFFRLAVVIALIIVLTSVFVIRNSFRISVTEKYRQYGLLASVGATSKQIKKSVLHEGFLIGLIGIPAGLLIGVVAVRALTAVLAVLASDVLLDGLHFRYSVSPYVFVVAIALSALTIYLACLVPARQAAKIAPVEAVCGNRDIRTGRGKLRSSRLIRRLFGIGGVVASNNLKRSRKRYRTTVVSLVLSVSVFIALSWFVDAMKKSVTLVVNEYQYNISVGASDAEVYDDIADRFELTDYNYSFTAEIKCEIDAYGSAFAHEVFDMITEDPERYGETFLESGEMRTLLVALNRDYFARYLEENGIDADPDTAAVLNEESAVLMYDEDGNVTRAIRHYYDAKEGDTIAYRVALPSDVDLPDMETETYTRETAAGGDIIVDEWRLLKKDVVITAKNLPEPMGYETPYTPEGGYLFVSEDFLPREAMRTAGIQSMRINAPDPDALEEGIMTLIRNETGYEDVYVYNSYGTAERGRRMILIIEIFLYGFIAVITLIGVTNIFNTITTNMALRGREFAMLKSVGMTSKQFNRMIALESVLYGTRSLLIGLPLGIFGSFFIYLILSDEVDDAYFPPLRAMAVAAFFVFAIVGLTMRYSLGKINRQNLIETIRSDMT